MKRLVLVNNPKNELEQYAIWFEDEYTITSAKRIEFNQAFEKKNEASVCLNEMQEKHEDILLLATEEYQVIQKEIEEELLAEGDSRYFEEKYDELKVEGF